MDASIEIRELRRQEVEEAVAFGKPLGVEASADAVRWTISLTARREGVVIGVALVVPDGVGSPRVWVAVDESAADRGGLICRLMDKAMLKLRSVETGSCAVTVCGEDGESMVSRTHWRVEGTPDEQDEATVPLRGLDEVVSAGGDASGEGMAAPKAADGAGASHAA